MIPDLFATDWASALGWTLLHSLWQSLLILLLVVACFRAVPSLYSRVRYAIACGGFLLMMVSSTVTFFYIQNQPEAAPAITSAEGLSPLSPPDGDAPPTFERLFSGITTGIQQHMPLIMTAWLMGCVFFMLRLLSGLWYTRKLTASALPLENEWAEYARTIAQKLRIDRLITLAQSEHITAPMVVGYFKPVILIPVGMLTGLSPEQLETIFLHELAHIKRHDYLINFAQSLMETFFFYNPSVWILSEMIRREREFCCDDVVIGQYGSAGTYAKALVQLEEVRLSRHAFALSLAENKNQLLNRIRRIMEKSVKNYSGRSRMIVPAVLLTAGLLCASWLSIQQEAGAENGDTMAANDTIKPEPKKGTAWYSRKSIITTGKDGRPHEEVVEEFKGDESLKPLMQQGVPDFSQIMPATPFLPGQHLQDVPDSIPPHSKFNPEEWDEFSKQFRDNFGKAFEQFYSFRGGIDPSTFMKEFEENFQWPEAFDGFGLGNDSLNNFQWFDGSSDLREMMENMDRFRDRQMDRPDRHDESTYQDNFQKYEEALRDALVRDGYLSKHENIMSMQWSDDTFKVNGKEIRAADRKKYQDIHDKYLGDS